MKVSEQWLREWVSPMLETQALADQVTMAGLEVDGIEPVAAAFSGVVVATVLECVQHPGADKLRLCQVEDGSGDVVQVVCGAPNVAAGQKVAFAQVGAVLPGETKNDVFKIKKAKLRGEESRGMICSASELGLEEDTSDGIMVLSDNAPVGEDFRAWMGLDDHTLELDLTPNRGDCLSLKGLAREVGVLNRQAVTGPGIDSVSATHSESFEVRVEDGEACPCYIGRLIKGVDVTAETPLWMVERLRRSGVRSIDPVVDVTNYVMLELGQPLHAFDLANLDTAVVVRRARNGERLVLLDGQDITLDESTLVIADEKAPLAIAGVMGGEDSGVNPTTRDVFLEAAHFSPLVVASQARQHGLHTDASHRFERGVDPGLPRLATERATALLLAISGGEPGPLVEAGEVAQPVEVSSIMLRRGRLDQALAKVIDSAEVVEILERLGMEVESVESGWQVQVPSWRFDLAIEEDLIEEIARIHGYNRLPSHRPEARLNLKHDDEARTPVQRLRRQMVARGYFEAITYSFVAPELQRALLPDVQSPVLANPISSDLSMMRASLFPGLIRALQHNLNRQQTRVRLFETGLVFKGGLDTLEQMPMFGGLACGSRDLEGWNANNARVDFFDVKGDLESLLAMGGNPDAWRFEPAEHPSLHPGQSARLLFHGQEAGWIGTLHPAVRAELDLNSDAVMFEVRLDLLTRGQVPTFTPLSRFPEVRRDLAFLLEDSCPVQALLDLVRKGGGEWLAQAHLFDVYQGQGVAQGYKSVALGLTWQHPSRTLNDEEISLLVDTIVEKAQQELRASLRA